MTVSSDCAVGRLIKRNDTLGGLDWQAPCPTPIGDVNLCLHTKGGKLAAPPIRLCDPHADVLLPALEAAKRERLGGGS